MKSSLLLVLPAYNEANRLPAYLSRLGAVLGEAPVPVRLMVVDDGSTKEESRQMQEGIHQCQENFGLKIDFLRKEQNSGKGAAVYAGWKQGEDETWVGFLDADGSIPPGEVLRLITATTQANEPDAFFASRCKILGHTIERSFSRHINGRIFATLVSEVTGIPIYDSQCGFKLLKRSAYDDVQGKLRETGFAFDVELLAALWSCGASVIEVPIDWFDVPGSKVRFFRDVLRMLAALMRIRSRFPRKTGRLLV